MNEYEILDLWAEQTDLNGSGTSWYSWTILNQCNCNDELSRWQLKASFYIWSLIDQIVITLTRKWGCSNMKFDALSWIGSSSSVTKLQFCWILHNNPIFPFNIKTFIILSA